MTTLARLFGAIPRAFESGTGSELRNPLGITIIGGLPLSQLLTLYTTPVIYLAMEGLETRLRPHSPAHTQQRGPVADQVAHSHPPAGYLSREGAPEAAADPAAAAADGARAA